MDSKISVNVKRLIELDQKSVALEKESENQLKALEETFLHEMEGITSGLQDAKLEAKKIYNDLMEKAQEEVRTIALNAEERLSVIEKNIANVVDELAIEMWDKIKDGIR